MINVWKFENAGKVKLIDIDGKEYVGEALDVTEAEEQGDECVQEDSITVSTNGLLIDFLQSEIQCIEKIQ